ncbi:MAG: hypothetical protein JWO76_469 [Nocardioides sp.]|nr:hypothetical protein [Nocardioides sp.]
MFRTLVAGLGLALTISSGAAMAAPSEDDTGPTMHARQCVTGDGQSCKTAKQYKRAFVRGDMGHTPISKNQLTKAFKKKVRRAAEKKGIIPPRGESVADKGSYKYADWGDYLDGLNNLMDCVAPGAESSCAKDYDKIKVLKEPAKVVLGCGGAAIMVYASGGVAGPLVLSGGLLCSWSAAVASW